MAAVGTFRPAAAGLGRRHCGSLRPGLGPGGLANLARAKAEAQEKGRKRRFRDVLSQPATLGLLAVAGAGTLAIGYYDGLWLPLLKDAQTAEQAASPVSSSGSSRSGRSLLAPSADRWVSQSAADRLARGEVVVLDGVLSSKELEQLRSELQTLAAAPGGLQLNPKVQAGNLDIRTDRVNYLRESSFSSSSASSAASGQATGPLCSSGSALQLVHDSLRSLAFDLQEGFAACGDSSKKFLVPGWSQLSNYSQGSGFYIWHVDGFHFPLWYWLMGPYGLYLFLQRGAVRRRSITALLYLHEEEWPASFGGALRVRAPVVVLHSQGQKVEEISTSPDGCSEILPRGGRLVLFDSHTVEHEVAYTQRERWALTVWIHQ
ncbi:unnamed protein product [Polarella glacialis]|uniref:Fe2OG dioxygenase domain-containing protein n=1 Tax=Polarella glacialis TaxID=89957 RepID=A0A813F8L2_POLGL|nr:unnamed protein product [Polarella glacialis]